MAEIAWLDCPNGRINDPFPGQCELYVDVNSNDLCDRGEGGSFVFWLIFLISAFYFIHWYLSRKTASASFRYFWNLVLLVTFIPAAISSILWLYGVNSINFSFWHYRLGLVFATVAVLHLLKRFRHILNIPRR